MRDYHHLMINIIIVIIVVLLIGSMHLQDNVSAQQGYPSPNENLEYIVDQIYLPLTSHVGSVPAPHEAPSYYITNSDYFYGLGHSLGEIDANTPGTQDNLVILDYGYPAVVGNVYGVWLPFDPTIFLTITDVITTAWGFAIGYYAGTGEDIASHIRVVIGVNNCCYEDSISLFQNHGTYWAQSVDTIRSQIMPYSAQVDVVGGNDIEQQRPGGNDPYATTQWVDNYLATSTCDPGPDNSADGCFYNFGNLVVSVSGTECAINRSSEWKACDLWYVSWGAKKNGDHFARPIPEIYTRYNPNFPQYPWGLAATAWKDLSLFSANQMNDGPIYFVGTLTQRARCGVGCAKGNNYPWEGYLLLHNALASNPTTYMSLRWSTDITLQSTPTPTP
jgi:hypothetical protein